MLAMRTPCSVWNVAIRLPSETAFYPIRKESSATRLWKPQNSRHSTSLSVCRETRLRNLMCNNFIRKIRCTECLSAFSPGHCDITRFLPLSPIATRNRLDRTEKIPKFAQTTGTVEVFDPWLGISGPILRKAYACPNVHEWWTQPARVRYPVTQLLI